MRIAAVGVAVVVAVALIASIPAVATAFGLIGALGSVAVFAWAAIGVVAPNMVQLPGRWHAIGLWVVSVVMLIVGATLVPDNERTRPDVPASAVEAMEEPEPESEIAADAWQEELTDRRAAIELDAPEESAEEHAQLQPEPTTEQELAALDRLNAASDRVGAVMSEMNRCAPPANSSHAEATAYAKCIALYLVNACPDTGEGHLIDMSRAAGDMGSPEASWLLEQAAMACWNAVFYADMPGGGTMPRYVGEAVTRMGEKFSEASAVLR